MAIISTIRSNGWLLTGLLGLALLGFILMDAIQNRQNYSSGDFNRLGQVNGRDIDRNEFEDYRKLIYGNSTSDPNQVTSAIWNFFVEKALVSEIAEGAGLGVHKEEMDELQYGQNLSPIIQQRFGNQQTGQIDRQTLESIKGAIESGEFNPDQRRYWAMQQKEIVKDRLQAKISNLISKAVYTPTWMAKQAFQETNRRADFLYVRVPFDKAPAEATAVTDADYNAYIAKNKLALMQTEETRVVDFVVIDVVATPQDSQTAYNALNKLAEGLRTSSNDSTFVTSNGGAYDEAYRTKAELPAGGADLLMTAPVGTVVGPFTEAGSYVIAKVLGRQTIADSVKARHILINPQTEGSPQAAEAKVDSLLGVLASGKATFAQLAAVYGTDATKDKGGDLGFFAPGAMVKPFSDLAFFKAEKGKPTKVQTQFGWHVLEVTDKKFGKNEAGVQAAFISQRIEPSKGTQSEARNKAIDIMNKANNLEELATAAREAGMFVQQTQPLKSADFYVQQLGSNQDVRNLVLWAYKKDTKKGSIYKDVFVFGDEAGGYFDSKYVVAGLNKIVPPGVPTLENVKSQIEGQVINQKRAEYLKAQIKSADLAGIAAQFGVSVDTANNISMAGGSLPNGGSEPAAVGAAFATKMGSSSAPIVGTNGVYVVRPITPPSEPEAPADLSIFRKQAASSMQSQVKARLIGTVRREADIKDSRAALGM